MTNNLRLVKKNLLEEIQGSLKFSDFHKMLPFMLYNTQYECIIWQFCSFFTFGVFECRDKVLCGISDNFSWQTIWDLSKKILLEEIQGSLKFSDFHKMLPFMLSHTRYGYILWQFCKFFTFRVLGAMTRCSAGSQVIFPDKQSETRQKKFCSKKSRALLNSVISTKYCHLCCISLDMSPFYANFASFSHFEFWVQWQGALRDLR